MMFEERGPDENVFCSDDVGDGKQVGCIGGELGPHTQDEVRITYSSS